MAILLMHRLFLHFSFKVLGCLPSPTPALFCLSCKCFGAYPTLVADSHSESRLLSGNSIN